MKRLSLLIAALAFTGSLFAQTPVNDNCSGLIDLGTAPICPPDTFTNVNATPSDIGNDNFPICFNSGVAEHDVWFMFTCPDTLFDFRITLTGVGANSIQNPEFAIYRGDCTFDGLAELLCAKANVGENALFLDVIGLTPGLPYFIRVSDFSVTGTANSGTFTLCVDKIPPITNIDDGGSTLCEGTVYDTGGPDGDYGPNEDFTFVICPNQPSSCITLTLEYYNLELGGFGIPGDPLTFYNGSSTSAPVITEIAGGGFGDIPPAAGGGVAFTMQATSGCLTIHFASDATNEFEGWKAHWVCSGQACPQPSLLSVNTNINADSIVASISTAATTVTVTNIDCPTGAYGTFNFATDNNELGLQKGLILTSGSANIAIGPNNIGSAGLQNTPFAFDTPPDMGDADLNYLSQLQGNGTPSYDACIVELDVFAATNELTFEYVFGSDEYPEYVNSNFNDIFAFLVSGPGIVGDANLANAKNIAVLPGTTNPVQINSVNNLLNWQYYRNNEISQTIQYDGLTADSLGIKKSLTARTPVVPCNTYHLKLAVSDRGDESFDSGVFVSEIKGGTPDLAVQFASGIDYFIEDCSGNNDQLIISLSDPLDQPASFIVSVSGTATLGLDYLLNIPGVITFQPGQTQLLFPIAPITDMLVEGTETIIIQLTNNFGCGTVVYKTLTIELQDNVVVNVAGGDTLFVCAGNTLQLQAQGAVNYFWAPPGAVNNAFIANPTITPTQDIWLTVTGTISTCVDVDSVLVRIISPSIDVVALTPTNICQGMSVQLQANNNTNDNNITWTPPFGLNDPSSANPVATPLLSTIYTATLAIAGCSVSDQVTINVDTLFFPVLIEDTTVCQNYGVQLAELLNSTGNYSWSPPSNLSDPSVSGPLATPDQTTTYTLTASSQHNYCSQTASVTVQVISADVDISGDEYREICLGDTVFLNAISAPGGSLVNWSPSFYVSSPTGANVFSVPDESITLIATYNVNNCIVYDSVRIRVDSLPFSDIMRVPDKSVYCPGDTVYLISTTYEPASFPDIDLKWGPFGGIETPDSLWNLVITATLTHTFERQINNRGCSRLDTVLVNVAQPPDLEISFTPNVICPGESVQITLTVDPPGTTVEWDANPTLSCTDCLNPVAMPTSTTQYTVSTPDAPCPSGASVLVPVLPAPALNLANNPVICPGQSVILNTAAPQTGVAYTWTSPAGLVSTSANPSVSPTQTTVYSLTAEGLNFCAVMAVVTVTFVSATIDVGTDEEICPGQQLVLNAAVTGTPGTITWSTGQTGNQITVSPGTDATYTATVAFGVGPECMDSDALDVTVSEGVEITDIIATPTVDTTLCIGESVTLKFTVMPPDAVLAWFLNDVLIPGLTGDSVKIATNTSEGAVSYSVTATNSAGCSTSADIASYNLKKCFEIPNSFTPGNGDGVNDTFEPLDFGSDVQILTFYVYNRWGQKVFEAKPGQTAWDGKVDGKDAPADVYAYYVRVLYPSGEEEQREGDLTLLR